MDTQAYDIDRRLAAESSPTVMAGIRAALIARGSSLRQWAHAWARAHGVSEGRTYLNLRMTIQRRLEQGQPPLGPAALRAVRALRADLGADLVPDFGERAAPQDRAA